MSIFSRATFSAAGYAAFRPSYPASLLNRILDYYQDTPTSKTAPPSPSGTLLDLGCGHGVVARSFTPHFSRAVGIDPSDGMVAQAVQKSDAQLLRAGRLAFRQGSAEDLSFLPDNSVDLVVAGQAAHWFDYSRAWPELSRVVRPGGALAFWGYKDNILVGHPAASALVERFCYAEDLKCGPQKAWEGLARYWEMPGRGVLRDSLRDVVPPSGEWRDVQRLVYDPDRDMKGIPEEEREPGSWLRKEMKLGEYVGYVHTFSSVRGWRDAHPEAKSRAEGGEGDIVDVLFDELREAEPEWKAAGERWREMSVEVVWGTALLMARRL